MRTLRTTILSLTAAAGLLLAQPRGGGPPPPDFTEIKAFLNLNDSQITSLQTIEKAHRQAAQALQGEMRANKQAMRTAMDSGAADAIAQASQAMKAHQQKMQTLHQSYQTHATAVLTPEQNAKLKVLSDAAALMPNIHAAQRLNLITPSEGAGGPGRAFGPGPGFGPEMRRGGPGRGPGGPGGPPPPPPAAQ